MSEDNTLKGNTLEQILDHKIITSVMTVIIIAIISKHHEVPSNVLGVVRIPS